MLYIGIDLGTSAAKFLLVDETGDILNTVTEEYPLYFPRPGWSEQNCQDWWNACISGIPHLLLGFDSDSVAGIGVGGQMHGLVALDKNDVPVRPAILWNDGRTAEEVYYLNNNIGKSALSDYTSNIAFAGFTAPKLLWMEKHEPDKFSSISKIMLPKDYINYKLTGVHCSDYSDASGTLLLDVKRKQWSAEMMRICHISPEQMPELYESYSVVGPLTKESAELLGLKTSVLVVAGAGDNAAAAVGTGTVGPGRCTISLGTSGTIFISSNTFSLDPNNALHSFAHADGGYHLMACMLSAASCNKWFCDDILGSGDYEAEQKLISSDKLGKNRVFFLPYLMGERSPINDTHARAVFLGMSMDTSRAEMVQAVLEGVAFAIRDSFEIAKSLKINIASSKLCGGGSKSPLWRNIISNVLGLPLEMLNTEQGPGYGAAILAMVGCSQFASVQEATDSLVQVSSVIYPDEALMEAYNERYLKFKMIYPALRDIFPKLN